jgi:hypothetical protein
LAQVLHEIPYRQPFAYCFGAKDLSPVVNGRHAAAHKLGGKRNIAGYDKVARGGPAADVGVGAAFGLFDDDGFYAGVFPHGDKAVGDKHGTDFARERGLRHNLPHAHRAGVGVYPHSHAGTLAR